MSNLSLELGEQIVDIGCSYCGGRHKSAYGFICKDGDAYSVYYATLHTGRQDPSAGLTLSIGKWWENSAIPARVGSRRRVQNGRARTAAVSAPNNNRWALL
jgi:hypothetical protein